MSKKAVPADDDEVSKALNLEELRKALPDISGPLVADPPKNDEEVTKSSSKEDVKVTDSSHDNGGEKTAEKNEMTGLVDEGVVKTYRSSSDLKFGEKTGRQSKAEGEQADLKNYKRVTSSKTTSKTSAAPTSRQGDAADALASQTTEELSKIYFDLETGGLYCGCDINQIAAVCGDEEFSCYVTPTKRIDPGASAVTKLEARGGVLYHQGEAVPTIAIDEALKKFIDWLAPFSPCILIAHNVQFDARHLNYYLRQNGLFEKFMSVVRNYSCTLRICRKVYPGRKSYKQVDLVQDLLQKSYDAHDAICDCRQLQELSEFTKIDNIMAMNFSQPCDRY